MKALFLYNIIFSLFIIHSSLEAQGIRDTIQIHFGRSSQMLFLINDQEDYKVLKQYDLKGLVDELTEHIQSEELAQDSLPPEEKYQKKEIVISWENGVKIERHGEGGDKKTSPTKKHKKKRRVRHSWDFDLGVNNYFDASGGSIEPNAQVKPWGSWYVGLNSIYRWRLSKTFRIEWGVGVNWYNFKFQNPKTRLQLINGSTVFNLEDRELRSKKSKLTVSYLSTQLVPMIRIGKNVRWGVGPYAAYRMGSHTKYTIEDDQGKSKLKNTDAYNLRAWKYGLRLQLRVFDTEMFFNYDLNTLFQKDRGPELRGVSFGVII